jgi:hypothetical protein
VAAQAGTLSPAGRRQAPEPGTTALGGLQVPVEAVPLVEAAVTVEVEAVAAVEAVTP